MLLRCRDHGTGYAFPAGCMRWGGAGVVVRGGPLWSDGGGGRRRISGTESTEDRRY